MRRWGRRGGSGPGASWRDPTTNRARRVQRSNYETAAILVPVGRAQQVVLVGTGKRTASMPARLSKPPAPRERPPPSRISAWRFFSTMAGRPSGPKPPCAARSSAGKDKTFIGPKKIAIPSARCLWAGGEAKAIASGRILGDSVNLTRRLVNEPADEYLSRDVRRAGRRSRRGKWPGNRNLGREARLEAERCGSLLAVAKGSSRPPRLVILRLPRRQAAAPDAGHRRQGRDVRLRRAVAQTARRHADHEVRHGRRRRRCSARCRPSRS